MGTNYYLTTQAGSICPCCKHREPAKILHIGKSSGGWTFALRVYPEQGVNTLEDWLPLFGQGVITDEYGQKHTTDHLLSAITDRSWARYTPDPGPHAEHGPNGLLRNKVDGTYCVGHGPGTYDYFGSDFS